MTNQNASNVSDDDIQDWSRHYDSIVWTVNTIFLTGIGGLLVYSYARDITSASKPAASTAPLFGLSLVFFALFYISGFRKIRRLLHEKIQKPELKQLVKNPYQNHEFSTWKLYCIYMFLISIAFTERLCVALGGPCVIYIGIGSVMGAVIWILWRRGRSGTPSSAGVAQGESKRT